MFVVTSGDENSSQDALELVHSIERELFDQLGRFNNCIKLLRFYPRFLQHMNNQLHIFVKKNIAHFNLV